MALTPGERIDKKKKIADTLGQQEWNEIDLTFEEFGFSTWDQWEGSRNDYVIEMLKGTGDDQALAQLDAYLHPTDAPRAPPQPDAFEDPANPWAGEGFRLFLSHISASAKQAGALREELARRSVDVFVAHDSIEPTEDWLNVIVYALKSCDACLALLSPGFRESAWTDQEVGFCIARGLLVIPLDVGVTPYGFLGKYQALFVKRGQTHTDIALAVFELLVRKPETRDAMATALVARWCNTSSFDGARENYSFLKKIPTEVWTQKLVSEVWEARERNYDLREANINWDPSDVALEALFANLPFSRPRAAGPPDDIPW